VLNRFKRENGLDSYGPEHIGATACDPIEILALLLSEEFDIVHYAGHGVFVRRIPLTADGCSGEIVSSLPRRSSGPPGAATGLCQCLLLSSN